MESQILGKIARIQASSFTYTSFNKCQADYVFLWIKKNSSHMPNTDSSPVFANPWLCLCQALLLRDLVLD